MPGKKKESPKTYHCSFCANHRIKQEKNNHTCALAKCSCMLCELTRTAQTVMKFQQALWRSLDENIDKNVKIRGQQVSNRIPFYILEFA